VKACAPRTALYSPPRRPARRAAPPSLFEKLANPLADDIPVGSLRRDLLGSATIRSWVSLAAAACRGGLGLIRGRGDVRSALKAAPEPVEASPARWRPHVMEAALTLGRRPGREPCRSSRSAARAGHIGLEAPVTSPRKKAIAYYGVTDARAAYPPSPSAGVRT